jgi:hypothetical protein
VPNFLPVIFRIVTPTPDDLPFPIWQWNPVGSIKEKRGLQENAADLVVVRSTRIRGSSISGDPSPHLLLSSCPVLFSECLPNDAGGQDREVAEKSTAKNPIGRLGMASDGGGNDGGGGGGTGRGCHVSKSQPITVMMTVVIVPAMVRNHDDADCDGDACGDAVSNADADAVVADVVVAIAVPVFDNALLFRLGRAADEYSRDPERLPIMSGRN